MKSFNDIYNLYFLFKYNTLVVQILASISSLLPVYYVLSYNYHLGYRH